VIPRCRWSSIAGETAKRSVKRISDTYALEVSCFRFSLQLHGFTVVTFSTLSLSSNNILDPVRCVRLQTRFDPHPARPSGGPGAGSVGPRVWGLALSPGPACGLSLWRAVRGSRPVNRSISDRNHRRSSDRGTAPGTVGRAPPRAVRATLCEPGRTARDPRIHRYVLMSVTRTPHNADVKVPSV
jgi:hypothetical protein